MYGNKNTLQFQGILYSLALHIGLVCVYFISTYTPEYQSMDFNLSENRNAFRHSRKKTHKKIFITDMDKTNQIENKPDQTPANPDEDVPANDSEIDNAQDMSFHPDAIAPRPLTRFKKIFPPEALHREVEAIAYVSVTISSNGTILAIQINAVKLKKQISPEIDQVMKLQFAEAAREIFRYAKFSPAIIKGKNVPVIMDIPLNFTLN